MPHPLSIDLRERGVPRLAIVATVAGPVGVAGVGADRNTGCGPQEDGKFHSDSSALSESSDAIYGTSPLGSRSVGAHTVGVDTNRRFTARTWIHMGGRFARPLLLVLS